MKELIVLMQNDCAIGIYTTEKKADTAANAHYEQHYKRGLPNLAMSDFHYRKYKFVVDGGAR